MSNKKEVWKEITFDGKKPAVPYVISNHGRFGVLENGKVQVRTFKPTAGNYRYNTRQKGKNKAIFLFREVAKAFLKKPSSKHTFIIHKDHDYLNDHVDNLRWATPAEHRAHTAMSPNSIKARERKAIKSSSHSKVLDEKKVIALKKLIWDPKRKLSFKQLAEKFGVSEMQIYRIKNGVFWYHVRVDNEPLHENYKRNISNLNFHEKKELKEKAEKEKRESVKKAEAKKRSENEAKRKAQVIARQKALAVVRAKKLKEKELESKRFRKLVELDKLKKAKSKSGTGKSKKNYSVIKIAAKKKKK